jgi:hypothetical protein
MADFSHLPSPSVPILRMRQILARTRCKWIQSRHVESGHAVVFFVSKQKIPSLEFAMGNARHAEELAPMPG